MSSSSRDEQLQLSGVLPPPRRRSRQLPAALRRYRPPRTLVALWALRLIVRLRRPEELRTVVRQSEVTELLGLDEACVRAMFPRERSPRSEVRAGFLAPALEELEAATDLVRPTPVENAALLAPRLGLSRVEEQLLGFVAASVDEEGLNCCIPPPSAGRYATASVLAVALGAEVGEVRRALESRGNLMSVGLIKRATGLYRHQHGTVFSLADSIGAALFDESGDVERLLRHLFSRSPAPELTLQDFEHVGLPRVVATELLRAALDRGTRGVNLLIHGAPGTGKTQLARALAAAVEGSLHELALEDHDGDQIHGEDRLTTLAISQRLLRGHPRAVVLFDEIEDAFPHGRFGPWEMTGSGPDKAATNRLIEENAVPTLWVANRVSQIDAAFLRRFDLVLELRSPPAAVRGRVLTDALKSLPVTPSFVERTARDPRLQLAHVTRAARVAELVAGPGAPTVEQTLGVVLEGTLAAQGRGPARREAPLDLGAFDLSLVNATPALDGVVAGLAEHRRGALCLHGPPGTGKTAFMRHLADRLGVPLRAYRASDLLDKYVGETEQRLARAFADAEREGAVLFLDEADSFLQRRGAATHSWERTQVNELLVQMECFTGIFACSTNLMEALDPASLRRFAVKIRFAPLTSAQRLTLFARTLGVDPAGPDRGDLAEVSDRLGRLPGLTAGDFAAVVRRTRLLGTRLGAEGLLAELIDECRYKESEGRMPAGFGRGNG